MNKTEENISKFLEVTGRLSKLLKQENEILSVAGRANGIKPFQEEKHALSNAYEQLLRLINNEEDLRSINPSLASRLRDTVATFGLLLEENTSRLKAKIEAGEHLFRIISESAVDHQGASAGYSDSGQTIKKDRQAYQPAVSVGLNQEL